MEWILICLADIRDWVLGRAAPCKRLRDNGKLIEFCWSSNKVGLFVVIAVYFGGSRRGCITILASSNRAGWSMFQRELRNFFTGEKLVFMAEESSKNGGGGGGGQSTSGDRSGKLLCVFGNQQKFKKFENFGTKLGQNGISRDPIENAIVRNGNVSVSNGRPTRAFNFKLTPAFMALRVCKPEGGRLTMTWLDAKELRWPKDLSGGPD
nr:hypothetical protein CFP56_19934 [Quercus suber]